MPTCSAPTRQMSWSLNLALCYDGRTGPGNCNPTIVHLPCQNGTAHDMSQETRYGPRFPGCSVVPTASILTLSDMMHNGGSLHNWLDTLVDANEGAPCVAN